MAILTIPDELMDRLRTAAAKQGQDENQYATAALSKLLATERTAASKEHWSLLYGPARSEAEVFAGIRARHNIPEYVPASPEERDSRADAALDKLDPEKRAEAERLGLI